MIIRVGIQWRAVLLQVQELNFGMLELWNLELQKSLGFFGLYIQFSSQSPHFQKHLEPQAETQCSGVD